MTRKSQESTSFPQIVAVKDLRTATLSCTGVKALPCMMASRDG